MEGPAPRESVSNTTSIVYYVPDSTSEDEDGHTPCAASSSAGPQPLQPPSSLLTRTRLRGEEEWEHAQLELSSKMGRRMMEGREGAAANHETAPAAAEPASFRDSTGTVCYVLDSDDNNNDDDKARTSASLSRPSPLPPWPQLTRSMRRIFRNEEGYFEARDRLMATRSGMQANGAQRPAQEVATNRAFVLNPSSDDDDQRKGFIRFSTDAAHFNHTQSSQAPTSLHQKSHDAASREYFEPEPYDRSWTKRVKVNFRYRRGRYHRFRNTRRYERQRKAEAKSSYLPAATVESCDGLDSSFDDDNDEQEDDDRPRASSSSFSRPKLSPPPFWSWMPSWIGARNEKGYYDLSELGPEKKRKLIEEQEARAHAIKKTWIEEQEARAHANKKTWIEEQEARAHGNKKTCTTEGISSRASPTATASCIVLDSSSDDNEAEDISWTQSSAPTLLPWSSMSSSQWGRLKHEKRRSRREKGHYNTRDWLVGERRRRERPALQEPVSARTRSSTAHGEESLVPPAAECYVLDSASDDDDGRPCAASSAAEPLLLPPSSSSTTAPISPSPREEFISISDTATHHNNPHSLQGTQQKEQRYQPAQHYTFQSKFDHAWGARVKAGMKRKRHGRYHQLRDTRRIEKEKREAAEAAEAERRFRG
ncbi:hypothetical protein HDU89_002816 [Geranomyces variabilis]|nr:hypothetical protein HDU89_002816 [Geranomyces variabilis]